jgi:hypothetical protein
MPDCSRRYSMLVKIRSSLSLRLTAKVGRNVAVDSKIKSRHTAHAVLKRSGPSVVRRIAAP